jgi:Flp pilus assembly pilin Flp
MQNENGQTNIEYGLVLMIVSIAIIGVMMLTVGNLTELYEHASTLVHNAVESV